MTGGDPYAYPPRGMNREEAARYVGVSPSKFDEMVKDRRMPRARKVDGRVIWDRLSLDGAFSALPEHGGNAIDAMLQGGKKAA